MTRRPLQLRLALWFALSVLAVGLLFAGITYLHLRYELKVEQWERVHPENPDFILHGTYSAEEIDDIAGHILHISLLISLPIAGLALLLGWYLARKSLRPVASINEQLQRIEATSLDARIRTPDADAELETITRNINDLLERIEHSYRDNAEFSARVAHELRTPLTLMRLQLEESSATIEPGLSENLQDELQRLEGYVDQCLLIARAERGQLSVKLETVDLSSLIEDVLEPFSLLAREEGRELFWQPPEPLEVEASPWLIRQILHNLLSNALKHGKDAITVRLDGEAGGVRVTVVNPVKDQPAGGTGIGLRIVDALAGVHPSLRHGASVSDGRYCAYFVLGKIRQSHSGGLA